MTATEQITQSLRSHLNRGGAYCFVQLFNDKGSRSLWLPTDRDFLIDIKLMRGRAVYWGVNPVNDIVTPADRAKPWTKGKTDEQIAAYIGTKDSTISAVNALYADFDGKDETAPTEVEIGAQYTSVKAAYNAQLAKGEIKALPPEKTLQSEALKAAKEAAFLTDIAKYKTSALKRATAAPIKPSALIDSGGGYQAYWLLADPFLIDSEGKRKAIKDLQAGWVEAVGADPGVKDIRRILRVPGSQNIKKAYGPDFPTVDYCYAELDLLYTVDDFAPYMPKKQEAPPVAPGKLPSRNGTGESVIAAFKAAYSIADVLEGVGYTWAGRRMAKPGGKNGTVEIYRDDNESYHFGGDDPLHDDHRKNPFDVFLYYSHGGNMKEAITEAARMLGMQYQTNGHTDYNAGFSAGMDPLPVAPDEAKPSGEQWRVALVAELLRTVIDVGGEVDDLRDAVSRLGEDERKQPAIIAQLERVFSKPADLKQWLSDCGFHGESMSKEWLTQLHRLGYHFKMNQLDDSIEVGGVIMSDGLESEIRCAMRDRGVKNMDALKDAYRMEAYHNSYHPIKDFLGALEWDGADHIGRLASYFTSNDTPITYSDGRRLGVFHAFLKRWLVGAVGKVYEQAQNITFTMAGAQGIGKSYLPKWLCSPMADFFNEGQLDPDGKETDRRLATTWIWEIGELGATTRRADVNALKNKLTQSATKFRVPYGHNDVIKPVLTSFFGTVNPDGRGFLMDKTGNRRFAVVNVEAINFSYTDLDPCQVWAQAVALYRAGEPWRLAPEEVEAQKRINKEHETDETIDMIMPELFILEPGNDGLAAAPIDIAQELYYKNYAKDLDKCAKDAAAYLKANGYAKKGKPATWRGIALRFPRANQRGEATGERGL